MQGCIQRVFFGDVNAATVRVLSAEGWEVHSPRSPRCCGALQIHAGLEGESFELAKATIAAYEGYDKVVINVAGCGSVMKDYGHLFSDDPEWAERAAAFCAKCVDVHELLAEQPQAVRKPIELRAAYHDACHLAHAQGVRAAAARAAARHPRPGAARARRVGAVLRLGRHLQPAPTRGGGQARRAQGRQPARDRRGRDRRGQPGLRAADRQAPRPAHLSPDDPARHVPQRSASREGQAAAPPDESLDDDPVRRRAGVRRRAAGTLRRPPRRAAAGAGRARRADRLPRGDRGDPRRRLAGPAAAARLRRTGAPRSPARPTASSSSTRSTAAPRASWPTSRTPTPRPGATRSRAT